MYLRRRRKREKPHAQSKPKSHSAIRAATKLIAKTRLSGRRHARPRHKRASDDDNKHKERLFVVLFMLFVERQS
jgi:hypothetical protein